MRTLRFLLAVFAFPVAGVVFLSWMGLDLAGNIASTGLRNHEATLPAMLDGTAERPFVARFLVPAVASAIVQSLPAPAVEWVKRRLWRNDQIRHYAEVMELPRESLPGCSIALGLALLSLFAFVTGISDLARWVCPGGTWVPVVAVVILPVFFRQGAHCIYDLPALAFSTLSLCALRRGSLAAYYALLGLGLMNKETQILAFTPLLLHLLRARASRSRLATHALSHAFALAALWCLRWRLFGENPGSNIELHLVENVNRFLDAVSADQVAAIALVAYLLGLGRQRAPALLRDALWMILPLALLYAVVGVYGEIRVLLEAFPQVYLVCCRAFQRDVAGEALAGFSPSPEAIA